MKRNTIIWSALLCLGMTVTAGIAGAAEVVVLAATNSVLKAGDVIDGNEKLSLEDGVEVTLVTQSGEVIELKGPWKGAPVANNGGGSGDPNLLGAVTQLVRGGGESSAPGAFRSGGDSEDPPEATWINTGRSGHYCVAAEGAPTLWREDAVDEEELKIRQAASGQRFGVFFEEDEATALWPDETTVQDGATYSARWSGGSASRQLTIHMMPSTLESDAQRIVWMLQHDCKAQAGVLLGAAGAAE